MESDWSDICEYHLQQSAMHSNKKGCSVPKTFPDSRKDLIAWNGIDTFGPGVRLPEIRDRTASLMSPVNDCSVPTANKGDRFPLRSLLQNNQSVPFSLDQRRFL
jgi:hypothetical protein